MNMKNMRLILVLLFCMGILVCCKHESKEPYETITVDFHDYLEKSVSEMPNEFYSNKQYAVLSSDKQNMILSGISNIKIYGERIFVADSRSRKFVVYDMNGYANSTIGNRGRGPGEYLNITDFDVDSRGRIHLIDGNADKILIYGNDYKFIEAKDLPFEADIVKCTSDGGYLFGLSSWDKSRYGGKRVLKTTENLIVENSAGEFNKELTDDNVKFSSYHFIETSEGIFYHRSIDENVYLYDENGNIKRKYYFDLGNHAVPIKYRNNLEPLIDSEEMNSYRALLDFAVPYGENIYGSLYDRGTLKSYVYDHMNNIAYTMSGDDANDFGYIFMISGDYLITFFPYSNDGNVPKDLPEDMRIKVANGDFLICLYKLKYTFE